KGHMSRFEDANWDDTEEDAFRNGQYTCFYTNACPQVVKLNRTGLWGNLEKAILEKGVKEEQGKLARMTVFNGPVFNEDKDRIFRGHVIPMEYYKIILWLNDAKKLRATAFKLSQETLVDHIRFEESMMIEEEALDIDKEVKFLNYQCSIKSLEKATGIDFSHIVEYDTFKVRRGNEESIIENEEALML
ncbi:MAG TPA: DNA/RNA non-specific endonuclease, partial [Chitinophagaceae bacterium]